MAPTGKRPSSKPSGPDPGPAADARGDDDAALFRAAIGPVRELPAVQAPPAASKPAPVPRMARRDEEDARSEFQRALEASFLEAGDAMQYRRDEVPPRVLRRLGRGDYAAQEELDLHHADSAEAEALLRRFLREAREAGIGCVRIVHGKGLHGDSRVPVLKNLVDRLLRQRADVLAFHSAPAAQGGGGAVLVLLKPR
ncbi:Smr/MutS family protein [Luteimonas aquatica]|uniref:Smr/MutS family protein n=1 Tax=Luteimonas aquatica TaxID=450364 RepID=UPI001F597AF4|nr:Smr/MutS family protein [Luteimonas aquatica]